MAIAPCGHLDTRQESFHSFANLCN